MLIDAGANVLHAKSRCVPRPTQGKERNFPKLFALLIEADAQARSLVTSSVTGPTPRPDQKLYGSDLCWVVASWGQGTRRCGG